MKILLAVFLFLHCVVHAQTTEKIIPEFIEKSPYLKSVYIPDSNSQARLFNYSWQYLYTYQYESFRSGGMRTTFGLNIARFFSDQFILGLCVDIKAVKGLTQQNFSADFVEDFNAGFKSNYNKEIDSARAYVVRDAINDVPGHGFFGNYSGNIGIQFSPFPQKYGGILFSAKRGYRDFPIIGTLGNTYINDGDLENTLFQIKKNYSLEVSFKPFTIFRNGYFHISEFTKSDIWKMITLSFQYEQLDLRNASFNGMPFSTMVNSKFMSKHGVNQCYGVRVGIGLY